MDFPTHEDRRTAEGFGTIAGDYDRSRPTYPPALVDRLLEGAPATVLDVGCGTGKAARLFLGGGRSVLGVEPDARMAGVARTHGLAVEVAKFETWDDAGRRFDLLISAQAWHWVDPVAGGAKAAQIVRPGGRVGLFWNEARHTAPARAVFDRVYGGAAELLSTSVAFGATVPIHAGNDTAAYGLAASGAFATAPGRRETFRWSVDYTPEDWVALVATYSDHRRLGPAVLDPLLAELTSALHEAFGDRFEVGFGTDLLLAQRISV